MKMTAFIFLFIFASLLFCQNFKEIDLSKIFKGHNGAFVLYNQTDNLYYKYNIVRCRQRFLPASTFKIPNSLIGLETKVIRDSNYVIKWSGKQEPIKEWERDHTLKSAIYFSVVPYYQELARRVRRSRMQYWLNKINYGNKSIGSRIDRFWLDNSLKISADEQLEFLNKFHNYKLPFSKRSIDIVKAILPEEKIGDAIIRSKTGTGKIGDNHFIGWLVGFIKEGANVYYFAFNIEGKNYEEAMKLRNEIPTKLNDLNTYKHSKLSKFIR